MARNPSNVVDPLAQPQSETSGSSRPKGTGLTNVFLVVLAMCCLISLSVNYLHANQFTHHTPNMAIAKAVREFKTLGMPSKDGSTISKVRTKDSPLSGLGGLSCADHGGPEDPFAQEMVYWSDIPSDANYVSPFYAERRYMTFEPDGGGWNNIRMAMESVVGLCVAMGRTLVLPPEKRMYLLGKQRGTMGKQKAHFSFVDFFPMEELAQEHAGLEIISMQEFLEREAMTGNLVDKETGAVSFPPENRTDWDGINNHEWDILREWLRTVALTPIWQPGSCLAAFPASEGKDDVHDLDGNHLKQVMQDIQDEGIYRKDLFVDNPVDVNSSTHDRLKENLAERRKLCIYDQEMQQAMVVHFMCNHKMRVRMLVHFYAFLFFEDWREDVWMKRFVRDHIRYTDEIQCAAARVVKAVRERARQRDPVGNPDGVFDSFHIRRGDFQFKTTRIPAEEIYENSKDVLVPNATVFIATDERNKTFFDPLREHYHLLFLDDFVFKELMGVNSNYFGMIDQLVASRGRIFVGCWFSTFTGYINRMRGYHSVKNKLPGYKNGTLPTSFYYATPNHKNAMLSYEPLRGGFFNREFPVSWRDIDEGVGMLPTSVQG